MDESKIDRLLREIDERDEAAAAAQIGGNPSAAETRQYLASLRRVVEFARANENEVAIEDLDYVPDRVAMADELVDMLAEMLLGDDQ